MCAVPECKRETTWLLLDNGEVGHRAGGRNAAPIGALRFKNVSYRCGLCSQNFLYVEYQLSEWGQHLASGATVKEWTHAAVRKIGQMPAPDIAISTGLSEQLGPMADAYKKALVCRAQNYGIGAMAYLRRVVEVKTDDLINVMIDLCDTLPVAPEVRSELVAAKSKVRYEEKLEKAAALIPEALKPAGVNPLGQLHKRASVGLHNKSDDECVEIFDDLKADFEYVFSNLHHQAVERQEYIKRVTQRAGSSPAETRSAAS